eukprot:1157222-Pelagomonas_calceolata.AAC.11
MKFKDQLLEFLKRTPCGQGNAFLTSSSKQTSLRGRGLWGERHSCNHLATNEKAKTVETNWQPVSSWRLSFDEAPVCKQIMNTLNIQRLQSVYVQGLTPPGSGTSTLSRAEQQVTGDAQHHRLSLRASIKGTMHFPAQYHQHE